MPIKSYLAHSQEGRKNDLIQSLSAIKECEITPSENHELIVIVTDTKSDNDDILLKEKIEAIESLKLLAMVSGFNSPQND